MSVPEMHGAPLGSTSIIHHGSPPRSRRRLFVVLGLGFAALVLAFGIGLYRYNWSGGFARAVTTVLPYPAAIVEGRVIRYSEYQDNVEVLLRFYARERAAAPSNSEFPSEAEIKARVLDRLIKDRLAFALAERYGIAVTSEQVRSAYEAAISNLAAPTSGGGKAKAETHAADTLKELYGLRPSAFKHRVLYPLLLRQKLEDAVRGDEALNAEKRKKAEAALAEIRAGKAFEDVALAYSEDAGVAATGGERGLIGRGQLAPEIEAAAFALALNETSSVVKSAAGYHVLRVTERQEAGGQVSKVRLQEILVKPVQLDDYLVAQEKTASIIVFVR